MNDTVTPVRRPIAGAGEHLAVVVAHPDDETFGCGSLIAQAARAGARVTVVCATRGEMGERRPDPVTDAWPLGVLREAELCQAALVLGVGDVVVLDHVDSGFDGPRPDGALVQVPLAALADELEGRLALRPPDVVLTLDGSDGHRDHAHVRDAVTLAVARLRRHGGAVRLVHACLARSLMRAWAAEMEQLDPGRAHLALDVEGLGRPDHELTALDTADVLAVRERAIACHLSQASPFDGLSAALRRRFLTVDHVVELPAPAAASRTTGAGRTTATVGSA